MTSVFFEPTHSGHGSTRNFVRLIRRLSEAILVQRYLRVMYAYVDKVVISRLPLANSDLVGGVSDFLIGRKTWGSLLGIPWTLVGLTHRLPVRARVVRASDHP